MARASILVLVLLSVLCANASRVENDSQPASSRKTGNMFDDASIMICGSHEIREKLTSDVSITKVRNMPWKKIMKIAEDYIASQTVEEAKLEKSILKIKEELAAALESEAAPVISAEQVKALIETSLNAEGSFGDLQYALDSACGEIMLPGRWVRGAYRKATAAFDVAAQKFFSGLKARDSGTMVLDECNALLPGDVIGSGDDASSCDELCQAFQDSASEYSAEFFELREGLHSSDIAVKLENAQKNLNSARSQLTDCKESKVFLESFWSRINELKAVVRNTNDNHLDAKEAFDMATRELGGVTDELKIQQETVEQVAVLAGKAEGDVRGLTIALNDITLNANNVKINLAKTSGGLLEARNALSRAQAADLAVKTLRDSVSVIMLTMATYADDAVLAPLRAMGLQDDMNVDDIFPHPGELRKTSGQATWDSVNDLHNLCNLRAKPIFSKIDAVNLHPLCSIGDVQSRVDEIDEAVNKRIKSIKYHLETVKTLFDIYRTEKEMDETEVSRRIAAGEPQGLYEIDQVFASTSWYCYLTKWDLMGGEFLVKYKRLGEVMEFLEDDVVKLTATNEALEATLVQRVTATKKAAAELEAAVKQQTIQSNLQTEATKLLNMLTNNASKMQKDLERLRKEMEDAKRKYEASKQDLVVAHKDATGLMELYAHNEGAQNLVIGASGRLRQTNIRRPIRSCQA